MRVGRASEHLAGWIDGPQRVWSRQAGGMEMALEAEGQRVDRTMASL